MKLSNILFAILKHKKYLQDVNFLKRWAGLANWTPSSLFKNCNCCWKPSLSKYKCVTLCPPTALRRRQAQKVLGGASSNKIGYVAQAYRILNLKGYQACIIGSKVTGFCCMVLFCLLVELHQEGYVPAALKAF